MVIDQTIEEMKQVFRDLPYGVEHTLHVLGYAETILDGESITGRVRETTALAAVLHDIGFVEAKKKHGSMDAPYQEKEGPPVAEAILKRAGASQEMIWRVCYIVGHHHTQASIDGIDFQILWEADCIENLMYNREKLDNPYLCQKVQENFKTETGRALAIKQLGLQDACQ